MEGSTVERRRRLVGAIRASGSLGERIAIIARCSIAARGGPRRELVRYASKRSCGSGMVDQSEELIARAPLPRRRLASTVSGLWPMIASIKLPADISSGWQRRPRGHGNNSDCRCLGTTARARRALSPSVGSRPLEDNFATERRAFFCRVSPITRGSDTDLE